MLIQLDHNISLGPTGCGQLAVSNYQTHIFLILIMAVQYHIVFTCCDLLQVHVAIAITSSGNL